MIIKNVFLNFFFTFMLYFYENIVSRFIKIDIIDERRNHGKTNEKQNRRFEQLLLQIASSPSPNGFVEFYESDQSVPLRKLQAVKISIFFTLYYRDLIVISIHNVHINVRSIGRHLSLENIPRYLYPRVSFLRLIKRSGFLITINFEIRVMRLIPFPKLAKTWIY